jgi:hypothetical protein
VLQFVIETSIELDVALFASWLYEKVKASNVQTLRIERIEITEITTEGIKRTLREVIERLNG